MTNLFSQRAGRTTTMKFSPITSRGPGQACMGPNSYGGGVFERLAGARLEKNTASGGFATLRASFRPSATPATRGQPTAAAHEGRPRHPPAAPPALRAPVRTSSASGDAQRSSKYVDDGHGGQPLRRQPHRPIPNLSAPSHARRQQRRDGSPTRAAALRLAAGDPQRTAHARGARRGGVAQAPPATFPQAPSHARHAWRPAAQLLLPQRHRLELPLARAPRIHAPACACAPRARANSRPAPGSSIALHPAEAPQVAAREGGGWSRRAQRRSPGYGFFVVCVSSATACR